MGTSINLHEHALLWISFSTRSMLGGSPSAWADNAGLLHNPPYRGARQINAFPFRQHLREVLLIKSRVRPPRGVKEMLCLTRRRPELDRAVCKVSAAGEAEAGSAGTQPR